MQGDVAAIVPAAGAGRRFLGRIKKPFASLNGAPLLAYALSALEQSAAIRWIIPIVHPSALSSAAALVKRYRITKALTPCPGGASRAESVARGFAAVPRHAKWILVHDGARPCLGRRLVEQAVRAAKRHGAVACGLPASLTVKAVDERLGVRVTLDREHLWFVQTPQVFRRDWFARALEAADHRLGQFPDDAALVESAGFSVRMIPGDPLNLKVTTREDLLLVKAILRRAHESRHRLRHSSAR